ncbi:unnamed protein product [Protopolystoma xenopodis]|uniref:Methyltransferase type 11 domain-containing protein n=1 Tax=Protopolystoma xenopodis TaxID=117903 RepID=A0A3S5BW75_9PLAT|nr:unnamed protein product [Protopolystoma xenopodis]
MLSLPYRPASFDFFICVAVIHHFCTEERRIDALKELAYLLRPGGRGLITVALGFTLPIHLAVFKYGPKSNMHLLRVLSQDLPQPIYVLSRKPKGVRRNLKHQLQIQHQTLYLTRLARIPIEKETI